jgi:hypothetical protein
MKNAPRGQGRREGDSTALDRGPDDYYDSGTRHLVALDKLLLAAQDIMKQAPALDRAAYEHLRQLRVKVRYALSESSRAAEEQVVPTVAPALWRDRANHEQSPLEFTTAHYGKWLHRGICRADIRRLDRGLYNAYSNWKITSDELDAIGLPTKKKLIEDKLAGAGPLRPPPHAAHISELPPHERERARLWYVARNRKQRKPK